MADEPVTVSSAAVGCRIPQPVGDTATVAPIGVVISTLVDIVTAGKVRPAHSKQGGNGVYFQGTLGRQIQLLCKFGC